LIWIFTCAAVGAVLGTVLAVGTARTIGGGLGVGTAFVPAALLAALCAASAAGVESGERVAHGATQLRLRLTATDGWLIVGAALLTATTAVAVGSRVGAFRRRGRAP
jgi:hypothetical protein